MSLFTTALRFLVRGGTAANLATVNEVPLARELVAATDSGRLKLGDGTTPYNDLPYINLPGPCFRYVADTDSTADSDPGAGLLKWNNATQNSATFLYLDDVTADTGTDLSTLYSTLAVIGEGIIHLVAAGDPSKFQVWKSTSVTDGTGYFKFAVTLLASSGSFADNVALNVAFHPYGGSGGGGSGAMTLLETVTVSGSAATSFPAFASTINLGSDAYILVISAKNATASNSTISLFFNSDTTATNYYRETTDTNGTSIGPSRTNDAVIAVMEASAGTVGDFTMIRDPDGYPVTLGRSSRRAAASISYYEVAHVRNNTANVTGITITASVANSLAVGSYAKLYRRN